MSQATWLWQQPGTSVTRKVRLGWLQLGQSLLGRPVIQGLLACSVFFTCSVFIPSPARYIFPRMSAVNSRSSQKRRLGRISGVHKSNPDTVTMEALWLLFPSLRSYTHCSELSGKEFDGTLPFRAVLNWNSWRMILKYWTKHYLYSENMQTNTCPWNVVA